MKVKADTKERRGGRKRKCEIHQDQVCRKTRKTGVFRKTYREGGWEKEEGRGREGERGETFKGRMEGRRSVTSGGNSMDKGLKARCSRKHLIPPAAVVGGLQAGLLW